MSLTEKIFCCSMNKINFLGNWIFAASVSAYQMYDKIFLNSPLTPIEILEAAVIGSLAMEISYYLPFPSEKFTKYN